MRDEKSHPGSWATLMRFKDSLWDTSLDCVQTFIPSSHCGWSYHIQASDFGFVASPVCFLEQFVKSFGLWAWTGREAGG